MTAAGRPRAEPRPPARLVEALEASLDGPRRRALAAARAVSAARGEAVYLVGGAVRDLLLGRSAPDLDLVVAGDGSGFAGDLAALLDATCTRHRRFLTAVVSWPGGPRLDLASSRREVYEAPGALPRVEPAPLAEDLARRDFTVNAMALELAPESGRLLDPHGGCEDLRRRLLRVLHPGSFLDDPTRIVRGLLFEHRFDLRFEPETERLARGALADGGLARLSRDRRSAALAPLLARLLEAPSLARRMGGLGLFAALHPELAPRAEEEGRLRRFADLRGELAAASPPVEVAAEWAAAVALLWRRERAVWRAVGADLGLDATASELPRRVRRLSAALGAEGIPPHRVDALLRELGPGELLALAAEGEATAAGWVGRWLAELRGLELAIGGRDLLDAGFAAGPQVGRALAATRDARLDGRIGAGDELAHAVEWLRREGGGGAAP